MIYNQPHKNELIVLDHIDDRTKNPIQVTKLILRKDDYFDILEHNFAINNVDNYESNTQFPFSKNFSKSILAGQIDAKYHKTAHFVDNSFVSMNYQKDTINSKKEIAKYSSNKINARELLFTLSLFDDFENEDDLFLYNLKMDKGLTCLDSYQFSLEWFTSKFRLSEELYADMNESKLTDDIKYYNDFSVEMTGTRDISKVISKYQVLKERQNISGILNFEITSPINLKKFNFEKAYNLETKSLDEFVFDITIDPRIYYSEILYKKQINFEGK